jgi:hypothetical protein
MASWSNLCGCGSRLSWSGRRRLWLCDRCGATTSMGAVLESMSTGDGSERPCITLSAGEIASLPAAGFDLSVDPEAPVDPDELSLVSLRVKRLEGWASIVDDDIAKLEKIWTPEEVEGILKSLESPAAVKSVFQAPRVRHWTDPDVFSQWACAGVIATLSVGLLAWDFWTNWPVYHR